MKQYICKFCKKETKPLGLASHERLCPKNPNVNKEKHPSYGRLGTNQYVKGCKMSDETKLKIGQKNKGKKLTASHKLKIKDSMKKAVNKYPKSYSSSNISGRAKIYEYNGFKLKGTWELTVAKYLDANNIKWTNIVKPFQYIWNNEHHQYFPDFYLTELDMYIEVKGYERDRDLCKWSVVSNLIIIKYKEIKEIIKGKYILK